MQEQFERRRWSTRNTTSSSTILWHYSINSFYRTGVQMTQHPMRRCETIKNQHIDSQTRRTGKFDWTNTQNSNPKSQIINSMEKFCSSRVWVRWVQEMFTFFSRIEISVSRFRADRRQFEVHTKLFKHLFVCLALNELQIFPLRCPIGRAMYSEIDFYRNVFFLLFHGSVENCNKKCVRATHGDWLRWRSVFYYRHVVTIGNSANNACQHIRRVSLLFDGIHGSRRNAFLNHVKMTTWSSDGRMSLCIERLIDKISKVSSFAGA